MPVCYKRRVNSRQSAWRLEPKYASSPVHARGYQSAECHGLLAATHKQANAGPRSEENRWGHDMHIPIACALGWHRLAAFFCLEQRTLKNSTRHDSDARSWPNLASHTTKHTPARQPGMSQVLLGLVSLISQASQNASGLGSQSQINALLFLADKGQGRGRHNTDGMACLEQTATSRVSFCTQHFPVIWTKKYYEKRTCGFP